LEGVFGFGFGGLISVPKGLVNRLRYPGNGLG
jgi:hypothetical protein